MNVIYGKDQAAAFGDKYIVLELDTFKQQGLDAPITAYCVVSAGDLALNEMPELNKWQEFHGDMISGYKTGQFSFCKDCMEYLKGKFGGELDTFYADLERRVDEYTIDPVGFNPVINR